MKPLLITVTLLQLAACASGTWSTNGRPINTSALDEYSRELRKPVYQNLGTKPESSSMECTPNGFGGFNCESN